MQTSTLPPMPLCAPAKGSIWQHFKGQHYIVVTVARHSEDPSQWIVVYEPWGDHLGDAWARTLLMTEKNLWPGFLDLRDTEGQEHRFRHVHGPRSWAEGKLDISPIFALSKLTAEAMRIEEGRTLNDGYTSLDSNPNYRRLVRVVRAAMETMFDEDPDEVELPAELFETPKVTDAEVDQALSPLNETVTRSSGNVFEDLGLPDADRLLREADERIAAMPPERDISHTNQLLELIRYEARNPADPERQKRILNLANRALGIEAT